MTQIEADYRDRVTIIRLNVDDPASRPGMAKYGVRGTPNFVMFAADGRPVNAYRGWPGGQTITGVFEQALALQ